MASTAGSSSPKKDPSADGVYLLSGSTTSAVAPATIDIPLESLATYRLLEVCPPGYLPKCVTKQLIYTTSSSLSSPSTSLNAPSRHKTVGGSPLPPYQIGTRLRFHFRTTVTNTGVLLDDTHHGLRVTPMELVIGKGFILEIWEVALNTMKEKEVVRFTVPKEMCLHYPTVAMVKRSLSKTRTQSSTSKAYDQQENGMTGYLDLDDFLISPQNLTFTLELLEVSLPGEYNISELYHAPIQPLLPVHQFADPSNPSLSADDDSAMSVERKADKLLVSRDYQNAAIKYADALIRIDQLVSPENQEEQQKKKISLLMKAAYCKLNSKNYTESLGLLTSVLEINADNPVALFRRGRCNVQTGDFDQARKDFARALELDPTYQKAVKPELATMESEEKRVDRS